VFFTATAHTDNETVLGHLGSYPRVKQWEHEADYSPPSSVDIENGCYAYVAHTGQLYFNI
jgi:hypothetical protein